MSLLLESSVFRHPFRQLSATRRRRRPDVFDCKLKVFDVEGSKGLWVWDRLDPTKSLKGLIVASICCWRDKQRRAAAHPKDEGES